MGDDSGPSGDSKVCRCVARLHGQHATKGIFITTSDFSRDANDYVSKIVLIDGSRLAELMRSRGSFIAAQPKRSGALGYYHRSYGYHHTYWQYRYWHHGYRYAGYWHPGYWYSRPVTVIVAPG
jgi:Restriction endonuclease